MSDDRELLIGLAILGVVVMAKKPAVPIAVSDTVVQKIADAIAWAEGFYVSGSKPNRNNNPGDLTIDGTGKGIGKDGMYVVYASAADGFEALEHQVRLMLTNRSRFYRNTMSILEVAQKYTATTTEQGAWASNVARKLGISIETKLKDIA